MDSNTLKQEGPWIKEKLKLWSPNFPKNLPQLCLKSIKIFVGMAWLIWMPHPFLKNCSDTYGPPCKCKSTVNISSIFVAFLENMDFSAISGWALAPTWNLGVQLTLFQPGRHEAYYVHQITACPPGLENLSASLLYLYRLEQQLAVKSKVFHF